MKITKIEVFRLNSKNNMLNSPIGCRIHTDEGIYAETVKLVWLTAEAAPLLMVWFAT